MKSPTTEPRGQAGKRFVPSKSQRSRVVLLVAAGFSEPSIADVLGICQNTLRKHFPEELRSGRYRKLAENLDRLDRAAAKGNVTAQKYLDARLGAAVAAPPQQEALGKKEIRQLEAQSAPHDSEWSELLH
jgi:predicted transcriptional regulator